MSATVHVPVTFLAVTAALVSSCGGAGTLPPAVAGTPSTYRATLHDPANDDRGPGSYVYPRGAAFPDGTFDLISTTIAERGEFLEVTVEIRGEFREWDFAVTPHIRERAIPQVIDVYIDQDGKRGSGLTRTLPGRYLNIAPESAWEKVLVIASPSVIKAAVAAEADPEAGKHAVWPSDLRLMSNRIVARFPLVQTGRPTPAWGYVVTIGGTSYVPLSEVQRRLGRTRSGGSHLRDVRRLAGSCSSVDDPHSAGCAFGGCEPCHDHPRVLDVILPAGSEQKTLLSAYKPGRYATVPAVYPFGGN